MWSDRNKLIEKPSQCSLRNKLTPTLPNMPGNERRKEITMETTTPTTSARKISLPEVIDHVDRGDLMTDCPREARVLQFPDWQCYFDAAVREDDPSKRCQRFRALESAIFSRVKKNASHPPGIVKHIALNDAIHFLPGLWSDEA
jgi:hypothetical protein